MISKLILLAYGEGQASSQVLGTSDSTSSLPSWSVFIGVAVILFSLAILYIFSKRRKK